MTIFFKNKFQLKNVLLILIVIFFSSKVNAQGGVWTWITGSNLGNGLPTFGTQGVPAPANTPAGPYEACDWTDNNGNFWMFGGLDASFAEWGALWKFDPVTNMWTWLKGPNVTNQNGVYGVQGVPAPGNNPGARSWGVATWVDNNNNLWMFGGAGYDGVGGFGQLNDLWMYNPGTNEWTWMNGPNVANDPGNYGAQGVQAPTNQPPSRSECSATFTDNSNDLWLFGGYNPNLVPSFMMNDMWRYNIASNQWTWMAGSNVPGAPQNYGIQGVQAPTNDPGARGTYNGWYANNDFWIYGGVDFTNGFTFSDMWRFDIAALQWTYMGGTTFVNSPGNYGFYCQPSTFNFPAGKLENRAQWTDICGRFWTFGGFNDTNGGTYSNDLWCFDPVTLEFTWISGAGFTNQAGVYGTQGVPNAANVPGARGGSCGFQQLNGDLWLFGGADQFGVNHLNDLWRFQIDPTCIAVGNINAAFNPQPASGCTPLTVVFNNQSLGNATNAWDFGDGGTSNLANPTHTFNGAGTYTVTLIVNAGPNGCGPTADTITATIQVNAGFPVNLGPDQTICPNTTVLLNAGNPGPGATYLWNNGTTGQTLNAGPGTWWAQVTMGGCVISDTVTITALSAPNISIDPVNPQCVTGNSFSFSVSGVVDNNATYSWTFAPDGTPATSFLANPTNIVFATGGNKTVIVNVTQYGCVVHSDTLIVLVYGLPNPAWMTTTGAQCFVNNNYTFIPTGNNPPGTSYAWTFTNATPSTSNVQNPTAAFNAAGSFPVTLIVTVFGCTDTLTQNVNVNPNPVVNAGLDVSFCEGEGGVMLNGVGTGGTQPYYWTWWCDSTNTWCGLDSVFDDNPIANPNVSAMYYVQITDFNGCTSAVDSAFVTVIPKPLVNAGPDKWICSQPAPGALLTPSITNSPGPFTYNWTPGSGLNDSTLMNPYARPDTTTIYNLVVTDVGTGCTSDVNTLDTNSTVTVHVKPEPIANAGPDRDLCYGESIMLNGIGYGAGPGYSFEWSPAYGLNDSTLANPIAATPLTTDYVLTVWSNGCPSIGDTITVNVHVNPTVDAGPDTDICLYDAGQLHAVASGDSTSNFYLYEWIPAAGLNNYQIPDPLASPTLTTLYYVQATSEFGCRSALDSLLLTIKPTPFAEAGINVTVCLGESVQLNGSYYYQTPDTANPSQVWMSWYPNQFITDTTIANPIVNPSATQYYYFGIQYNTCFTLDSVLVTVMPSPGAFVAADTNTFCEGDSVQLFGSGGLGNANFTWIPALGLSDPNVFNPWATPVDTTTYMLIVEEGGCRDTTEYTLNPIDGPQVSYLASNPVGCVPFDVSFLELISAAEFYTWSFGDGTISNEHNPLHTYSTPGNYPVLLTAWNTGSCKSTLETMIIVVKDTAHVNFVSDPMWPAKMTLPEANVKFTDHSLNAWSWNWIFSDGLQSGEKNPIHNFYQEGEYYVTLAVTNEVGCVSEITHGPYIVVAPTVFIPNVFTPNDDKINDEFLVKYTGDQPFFIQVFDRWGNLLYETRDKYAGWDGKFKGVKSPEGVYYYIVKIAEKGYSGNVTLVR